MKNTILMSFLVSALVSANIADAALYKGVDSEGKVVYSDKPFDDAKKFTPPPISVMDMPKVRSAEEAVEDEKPAEFKYTKFNIISPVNLQTIRDEEFLNVSIELEPGLNAGEDHSIWLMMDNKALVKKGKSLSLQLEGVERGAHQIQAQVRDRDGKVVLRTKPVTVFVHRTSAR